MNYTIAITIAFAILASWLLFGWFSPTMAKYFAAWFTARAAYLAIGAKAYRRVKRREYKRLGLYLPKEQQPEKHSKLLYSPHSSRG